MASLLLGKGAQSYEIEVTIKDGSKKFAEVSANLVRDGKKIIGMIGVIKDILSGLRVSARLS
jgi:PAS domain S-box-containing protein